MGERAGGGEGICQRDAIDFFARQVYNLTSLYDDRNTEDGVCFL